MCVCMRIHLCIYTHILSYASTVDVDIDVDIEKQLVLPSLIIELIRIDAMSCAHDKNYVCYVTNFMDAQPWFEYR